MAYINVLILLYLISFPVLLQINKRHFKGKNKKFNAIIKTGRKIHPIAGLLVVVFGLVHGYQMLGGQLLLHTGSLLLVALIANGCVGFLYKKTRQRKFALLHQTLGILVFLLFLLHYFNPWLI